MRRIGVLALQGDFAEHLRALARCGVEAVEVRRPGELDGVAGLILPGGESTTMGMLMERFGLLERIRTRAHQGMAVWGTCAGMILLAKEIVGSQQPRLGLMDITVERNAYGRQIESFEAPLAVKRIEGGPITGVFIRAPVIRAVGPQCEVLAEHGKQPVLVQQGGWLAGSFHPELTDDLRLHEYFAGLAGGHRA